MLAYKQLYERDISHKSDNIESISIRTDNSGFSSIYPKGIMEALDMARIYLKSEYNCIFVTNVNAMNPYYVVFGEGDNFIYGMKYDNKKIYTWDYIKSTKKYKEILITTLDFNVIDFYVYSKPVQGYEDTDIEYYFKIGASTENIIGYSFETKFNSLYYPGYYTPNFGVGYYNKNSSSSSSSFLTLFVYVGNYIDEKNLGSGIDFSLDPRPLHFIDQDGTAIQIATERCVKNASEFDFTKDEINADDTRLITEGNVKVAPTTLEEYQRPDWITVSVTDGIEEKTLYNTKYNHCL